MNDNNTQRTQFSGSHEVDKLAEAFLDLWQDNIRCWSEERDLFTLQSLVEAVHRGAEEKDQGDDA